MLTVPDRWEGGVKFAKILLTSNVNATAVGVLTQLERHVLCDSVSRPRGTLQYIYLCIGYALILLYTVYTLVDPVSLNFLGFIIILWENFWIFTSLFGLFSTPSTPYLNVHHSWGCSLVDPSLTTHNSKGLCGVIGL